MAKEVETITTKLLLDNGAVVDIVCAENDYESVKDEIDNAIAEAGMYWFDDEQMTATLNNRPLRRLNMARVVAELE